MTTQEYYNIVPDKDGWKTLPNGNKIKIGNCAKIGNYATIGNYAIVKTGQTTEKLNEYFISIYSETSVFWKFVTTDFKSPGWGASVPILYEIGTTVEEPRSVVSDQQCGTGLHVFRPGILPEFVGLNSENLICLEVEVKREDICFGGLPGNDMKLRVKKLKVIRKIST